MMLFYISLLAICGIIHSCPHVKPAANYDFETYTSGKWYEIARYRYDTEDDTDCTTFNFGEGGNLYIEGIKNKIMKRVKGSIYSTEEIGRVLLYSEGTASPNMTSLILATDNTHYVIFYNCFNDKTKDSPTEFAWILSRTPEIDSDLKAVIHKYIDESHILDSSQFIWDHLTKKDCVID